MTYKTAQIAKLIGVHPNTIRFYEDMGCASGDTKNRKWICGQWRKKVMPPTVEPIYHFAMLSDQWNNSIEPID